MYELIKTKTEDKVILNGLYVACEKHRPIVLHLHGFEGDFFNNAFVDIVAKKLHANGFGFLSIQTRGTASEYALDVDLGNDIGVKKCGAHYELLEEAYRDIDAGVNFLVGEGYSNIVLQGHSLGTIKVVRYMFEGKLKGSVKKLVLLAPFDKNYLAEEFTGGRWASYVKKAEEATQGGLGTQMIPKKWDEVGLSYQTYVSWYKDDDLSRMFNFYDKGCGFPILNALKLPVKVIVGSEDEYFHRSNQSNPQEALDIMSQHIGNFSSRLIQGAHHTYTGFETVVADEITSFLEDKAVEGKVI